MRLAVVCGAGVLAPCAGAQTFRLDGTFSAPPNTLIFDYARSTPAVDKTGTVLPPNQPRYARAARLLCGAPVVRQDLAPSSEVGGAIMAAAAGVGSDGVTPMLLLDCIDPGRLQLRTLGPGGFATVVYQKQYAYGGTTPTNLLLGEAGDLNAQGVRYSPTHGFSLCHGLIVACCQVQVLTNSTWVPSRTAVCYWDMAAPGLGWRVIDNGPIDNSQPGMSRGSPFQTQGYAVLDSGPVLKAWFPFSDYVQSTQVPVPGGPVLKSDTGIYYLLRATRPGVGQAWTLGPLAFVYSPPPRVVTPLTVSLAQHAHPPYLERFGALGLRLVCPIGDSWARNRIAAAFRTDENYDQAWTVVENMHGTFGTEFDPWVGAGNQFIGSAPVGAPGQSLGHVIGSDESSVPIMHVPSGLAPGQRVNATRVYGEPTCSNIHAYVPARIRGWNVFQMSAALPEAAGPTVALLTPGSQPGWMFDTTVTRVLYSPDGLTYGQAWATQDVQQWPPRMVAGRIVAGTSDRIHAFGLRSVPVPVTHAARPLVVGDGGVNLLRDASNHLSPGTTDAGNRVTVVQRSALARQGVVPPPCAGPVYECALGETLPVPASRRVGTWQLTTASAIRPTLPAYGTRVQVRAWLYPLPWDGTTNINANTLHATFALGRFDAANPANPLGSAREEFDVGGIPAVGDARAGWIPLTLDTDSSQWTAEPGFTLPLAGPTPFALGLRVRGEVGGPINPVKFLLAFESVLDSAGSTYGVPPAAQGVFDQDHASIAGFQCGQDWTIRLAGEVPDDSWDQTLEATHLAAPLTLCTLKQDNGNHIQIIADPASRAVRIVQTTGGVPTETLLRPRGDSTGHERFCFLRGSPVLLCVSQKGPKVSVCVSIGGTSVAIADLPATTTRPSRILFGDAKGNHPAAMNWYGGRVDVGQGISGPAGAASLSDLQFLVGN